MLTYHHYTLEGDGCAMGFENSERLLKCTNPIAMQNKLWETH
jgi:hypothetical protein